MIRRIKWAWQRVYRGYDDRLFWSMSDYLDPMVVAVAKDLRDRGLAYPSGLTVKKWHKVLDTIITGLGGEPDWQDVKAWKKHYKVRQQALMLLAVYWDQLWD